MKNLFKIIFYLIYLIAIFFINEIRVLNYLLLINFIVVIILEINNKLIIKKILNAVPIILFTIILNILIVDIWYAAEIGAKIILAYMASIILIELITIEEFIGAINTLIKPLKKLNIDVEQISLIMLISLNIIPNMLEDTNRKIMTLKLKCIKIGIKDISTIIQALIISWLIKVAKLEKAMILKGYNPK